MEDLNLELSGAPFERAMKPVLESLKEFRALVMAIDKTPTGKITAEMQALKTGAVGAVTELQRALQQMPALLNKQVEDSVKGARSKLRAAGKSAGDEVTEGAVMSVRANRQRLQAEYEAMFNKGWKIKAPVLQDLRAQGISLFPEDARSLQGYKDSAAASSSVLAVQRRVTAQEAAQAAERLTIVKRAADGLRAFRERAAKEDEAKQQAHAEASFRIGKLLARTEAASAAERLAIVDRAGKGLAAFRAQQARADQAEALRVAGMSARSQLQAAMANPSGAYSVLGGARAGTLVSSTTQGVNATRTLTEVQRNLAESFRSTHSAARGLASGFNAMWLTWGQLGPLLAGAAISNAFVSAMRSGSEFEQRLAAIRHLGGESADSINALSLAALDLGRRGPFGPVEVAGALKTLSLAGLSAKEQLAAIKPVLNFSIAGEMPLEKAAESLVGIATAYGFAASGYSTVSDVVAKAAAVSMSSVDSMTESFKQASTVAQQYGVSIQDSAATLALLSQLGIRGTAAGTAMRNMYNDLIGRSKEGRRVLKEVLDVSVMDNATKAMKPLSVIITEMSASLSKMPYESQLRALKAFSGERGLKALSADLIAFTQAAKDSTTATNRLEEIRQQLEDAPGFSAMAAIGMAQTTQNQIKSVFSSLQSSLVESFQQMQPAVQGMAHQLRAMFGSDEFRQAISGLTSGIAGFVKFLIDHEASIRAVALGYVAAKVGLIGMTAAQALAAGGGSVLAVALGRVGATAAAASVGMRALTIASGPLGWIVAIAGALGTAYMLAGRKATEGLGAATTAANAHYASTIEGINEEIKRLEKESEQVRNTLAGKVMSFTVEQEMAIERKKLLDDEAIAAARARHEQLLLGNERRRVFMKATNRNSPMDLVELHRMEQEEFNSSVQVTDTEMNARRSREYMSSRMAELFQRAKEKAELDQLLADKNRVIPDGTDPYKKEEENRRGAAKNFRAAGTSATQMIQAYKQEADLIDSMANEEQRKTKLRYDLGLMAYETFESEKDALQRRHTEARQFVLATELIEADSAIAKIRAEAAIANAKKEGSVTTEEVENAVNAVRLRISEATTDLQKLQMEQAKYDDETILRRAKPLVAATKASEEMRRNMDLELEALTDQVDKRIELATMGERDAVIESARFEAKLKFRAKELELIKLIREYEKGGGDLAVLANANAELLDLRAGQGRSINAAGNLAGKEFDAKRISDTAQELKSGIADAIMEGGEEGAASLRKTLEDALIRKPLKIVIEAALAPMSEFLGAASSSLFGSLFNGIFGSRAGGGPVTPGNRYLVGEQGPEIVEFGGAGNVYSANESARLARTGEERGNNVHLTVAPQITIDSRTDQAQILQLVGAAMQQSQKQMVDELKQIGVIR